MSINLNLQNQYNNPMLQNGAQPQFAAQSQYAPNMTGSGYDAIKERAKDNALTQATKDYDVMEHPGVLAKNFLLCMLMSIGFTGVTNYLMSSKGFKDISENVTNLEQFKTTRLYKAGGYLDNKISGSFIGKFFSKVGNGIKTGLKKIPVPEFVREVHERVKIGSIAVLDKQGMYSLGKGAEALNEFVEFMSQASEAQIKALGLGTSQTKEVLNILKEFRRGNIRGPVAFNKIAPYLEKVSAKKLASLGVAKASRLDKLFTTAPNVNLSLNKARFFNGALNKSQGPIAKGMQKFLSLVGEASGGGVLGGKMALFMNAVGLMTGFNAASNAEKGDKLKAFMEDYIGFTLGSYLMSFVVGTWFNKLLGASELGLDKDAVLNAGKKLGVDMSPGRLQDAVIAYNKEFRRCGKLEKLLAKYRNGKMPLEKAIAEAQKLNIENISAGKTGSVEFLNAVENALKGRKAADFNAIRKDIQSAFKSKLTIKSIFKADKYNKGKWYMRLGKYLYQKPLSLIGRALSIGRYDLLSNSNKFVKTLKWGKRFGGGLGRALLVMFVLVEPFRKGFVKLSHLIFGKPKKSALDKDEKKTPAPTPLPPEVMQNANMQANMQNSPQSDTNILSNMLKNPPHKSASAAAWLGKDDKIKINPDNVPELKRTYIPSAEPDEAAMRDNFGEDAIEAALRRADAAEKSVMDILH